MKPIRGLILVLILLTNSQIEAKFLTPDPVQPNPNTGQNFNRYWYANNNPVKNTDPDGREVTCSASSCTMKGGTVGELIKDTIVVTLIKASIATNNLIGTLSQSNESATTNAPPLPEGLIGENPEATGKYNGEGVGTNLPADKFPETVKDLTGDSLGKPDSKGRSTSPNGISVRTGGKDGPRIDIPANGEKPPEIIHFPKDTPIPSNFRSSQ